MSTEKDTTHCYFVLFVAFCSIHFPFQVYSRNSGFFGSAETAEPLFARAIPAFRLYGIWSQSWMTAVILSDDGTTQMVKVTTSAGSLGKRFVRLRVTRL